MGENILKSTETVLNSIIKTNDLDGLPDEFVANLLLESSGYYYKSLDPDIKIK